MSLGLLCLPISNNVVLAVSSAILWGVGHGLIHIGIMVLTKTYSINFTNALITLNIVYGMGAVVSPFLVECFRMVNLEDLFVFCALISILVGVVFFQISQQKKLVISYKLTDLHRDAKMISLFSILIFISNGANCGLADWIYTHIVLVTQSPSYVSSAIVSFYWLAQIFGRIVSMFIVGRVSDQRIMEICGATSLIGGVFLFFSDSLIMIAIGTVVISLGYAPMYPLILALGEKESIAKGKVLGYLSSSASFGAIVIPFIQGKAGKSETGGMGVIFVCSIIICIIIYSYAFWNRNATKK
jgi:fucose permease